MRGKTYVTVTVLGIILFSSSVGIAGNVEDAQSAYGRGDYKTAYRLFMAARSNAEAQNTLGVMYEKGQGVPEDSKEAIMWLKRAADQGYAAARYNLGLKYDKGRGVPQDYGEAMMWYRLAADQGYADAQCNLGVMYGSGRGVSQDYKEAFKWYTLAAEGKRLRSVQPWRYVRPGPGRVPGL